MNNKAVGRSENQERPAVINCPPAPPVPVVLYEIKVTEEVKNSEPISKQKRVQDWINEQKYNNFYTLTARNNCSISNYRRFS